jgi:hypothetical protein
MNIVGYVGKLIQENSLLKSGCGFLLFNQQTKIAALVEENQSLNVEQNLHLSQLVYQAEQITSLMKIIQHRAGQTMAQPVSAQAVELIRENDTLRGRYRFQLLDGHLARMVALVRENDSLKREWKGHAFQLACQAEQITLLMRRVQGELGQGVIPAVRPASAQVAGLVEKNRFLRAGVGFQQACCEIAMCSLAQNNDFLRANQSRYRAHIADQAEQIASLTKEIFDEPKQAVVSADQSASAQIASLVQENRFLKAESEFQLADYQAKMVILAQQNDLLRKGLAENLSHLTRQAEQIAFLMKMRYLGAERQVKDFVIQSRSVPTPEMSLSYYPEDIMDADTQRLLACPGVELKQIKFSFCVGNPESDAVAAIVEPAAIWALRDNAFIRHCFPSGVPMNGKVGLELVAAIDRVESRIFYIQK